jgi:hypothetical protein
VQSTCQSLNHKPTSNLLHIDNAIWKLQGFDTKTWNEKYKIIQQRYMIIAGSYIFLEQNERHQPVIEREREGGREGGRGRERERERESSNQ